LITIILHNEDISKITRKYNSAKKKFSSYAILKRLPSLKILLTGAFL
jgi:hypothetical protein